MPFARLTLSPALEPATAQALAKELTDLIASGLSKHHELTSVLIETPGSVCWTIGANPQSAAAQLAVEVSAGTNTEEQKRAFVAHAMALLHRAIPSLSATTYVVIQEIPATDWGYGGLTQADRARGTN